MKIRFFLLIILLFSSFNLLSQNNKHTLSGFVVDKKTGDHLAFATVSISSLKIGTSTNENGYFKLEVPLGKYIVEARLMGYKPAKKDIEIINSDDKEIFFSLEEDVIKTDTIVSIADKYKEDFGVRSFSFGQRELMNTPKIAEPDPLRSVQILPGVGIMGDFNNQLYLRGGGADETMTALDGVPVYNPNHLGTIFSAFNSDVIKSIKLYPSNYPIQYSGFLSGVMDLKTKDGTNKYYKATASASFTSARLSLEGPLLGGTFVVGARRTYLDVLAGVVTFLSGGGDYSKVPYYFYDIFGKYIYPIKKNDLIIAEFLYSKDVYCEYQVACDNDENEIANWKTRLLKLSYSHKFDESSIFDSKIYLSQALSGSNLSVINGYYQYERSGKHYVDNLISDFTIQAKYRKELFKSGIEFGGSIKSIKYDYNWNINYLELEELCNTKAEYMFYDFAKNPYSYKNDNFIYEGYISAYTKYFESFLLSGGLKIQHLNKSDKTLLSPSLSLSKPFGNYNIHFNYGRYYQYSYSIREYINQNGLYGSPVTVLFPSEEKIPQSDHISLGVENNNLFKELYLNLEIYYKKNNNLPSSYPDEPKLRWEKGSCVGLDVLLRKDEGIFSGWLAYSLMKAVKTGDYTYYTLSNRTHNFKIFSEVKLSEHYALNVFWIYASGNNYTPTLAKVVGVGHPYFYSDYSWFTVDGKKNSVRTPGFHRLDIGVNGHFIWGSYLFMPYLQIMNVYNNKNILSTEFKYNDYGKSKEDQKGSYILPSLGLTLEYQF